MSLLLHVIRCRVGVGPRYFINRVRPAWPGQNVTLITRMTQPCYWLIIYPGRSWRYISQCTCHWQYANGTWSWMLELVLCSKGKVWACDTRWDYSSQVHLPTLVVPRHWSRVQLYYCCLDGLSDSFSSMPQGMALSAGAKITGNWEANIYIPFAAADHKE